MPLEGYNVDIVPIIVGRDPPTLCSNSLFRGGRCETAAGLCGKALV